MARLSLKTKTTTNDLVVNIGTSVNDKTGDPLRTAFGKLKDSINQAEANFIELYSAVGADIAIPTQTNNSGKYLTTNGTTLRWDNLSNSIYAGGPGGLRWEFEELTDDEGATYYGRINFPDGSFQSTAFVGLASTAQDLYKDGEIFIGIGDGATTTQQWSFGNDGALTLPNTATILSGNPDSFAIYANPNAETVIGMTSQQGNEYVTLGTSAGLWQFDARGTLNTPLLLPKTFTAVLNPAHYSGEGTLVLEGEAWSCGVQFQVNPDGSVQTVIDNPVRATNPGYSNGLTFNFVEADHGIPGYTFTITLSDIQHPIPEVWTVNIAVSQPPAYPATVKSLGAVKLTADTQSWVFGTDGDLTAPGDITASFFMGQTLDIIGAGAVSSTYAGDLNTLHVTGNVGNGLTLGVDGGLVSWLFKPNGTLTLPQYGWIQGAGSNARVELNAVGTNESNLSLTTYVDGEMLTSGIDITPAIGINLNSVRRIDITAGWDSATFKYDAWQGAEQTWVDIRNQDAEIIAPETRPWAGMPSYTAYDILMGYTTPPGVLPPSNAMAQSAATAKAAYEQWQAEQAAINVTITAKDKTWIFGNNGSITLPAGGDILDSTGTSVLGGGTTLPASTSGYLKNNGSGTLTWDAITIPTTLGDLGITAGSNGQFLQTDGAGSYTWQNVTGAVVVAAPLHSYGASGDVTGMIAFDLGYFYWCFQDYVDNSTDCWKRVNAFAGSW